MPMLNLLQSAPKAVRDIDARRVNKEANRAAALKFGVEYFDGTREQGYGGYKYDGRWVDVARRIIDHWDLKPGDRILDIGCGKGFLVKDLSDMMPELDVVGIDISDYALENAHPDAASRLSKASCDDLPFEDDSFRLALAFNTIHNLKPDGCLKALKEMQRVAPRGGFVQVDAYRSEDERQIFEDWMLTAQTYLKPDGWKEMFEQAGYTGDYYWTILEADGSVV